VGLRFALQRQTLADILLGTTRVPERKRALGALDFADLEERTIWLLMNSANAPGGAGEIRLCPHG